MTNVKRASKRLYKAVKEGFKRAESAVKLLNKEARKAANTAVVQTAVEGLRASNPGFTQEQLTKAFDAMEQFAKSHPDSDVDLLMAYGWNVAENGVGAIPTQTSKTSKTVMPMT